ncbi:uncharacterized protein CC84DRAFT_1260741 [Paraphaeosphaeria sporulosa]|uniref:Chitin-binding type-1 domain-containing protein n=1 Tax=Paraphaeosphaeria sporulosa TaxID=1460663 RepID=A0A177C9U0_9PLEO|nr:uncharacterized protein CC84DRAFT_1260741 [Paraphaeosphaeria sporulosa]OAG03612.1 hypothetical protein CC84DRAFT_1260741 [Paraphaeosphaeria sporulosa]
MLLNSIVALALLGLTGVEAAYVTSKPVSKNARCGKKYGGATCQGSKWGNCCSQNGYCGSTKDHCEVAKKCQGDFGTCKGGYVVPSSTKRTTLSTSIRTSSSVRRTSTKPSSRSSSPSSSSSVVLTSASPSICSAVTITEPATIITIPGEGEVVTVTVPATITEPATTVTIPGEGEVVTITVPATITLPASTLTLPAPEPSTITLPAETLPASTITLPAETLPATTITLPAPEASTVTLPAETLPASTITLPAPDASTITLPAPDASTVTTTITSTTTSAPSCSAVQALKNPSFESNGVWAFTPNTAISSGLIRGSSGSANPPKDGLYLVQSAIDRVLDVNSGHRITQAVRVCPGQQYRFSIWLRTISASTASRPTLVQVFINGVRVLTSTPVTLEQGWTEFPGSWGADASTDAAAVQIVLYNESPVSSGTWSYLWVDLATLSPV